jgi:hypothetical protein
MKNLRKYGEEPFEVAVIHGGPGAPGEMAPVAGELAQMGDYDGHPYQGVAIPLAEVIKDFQFILLKDCGHYPWNEFYARDEFYGVLKKRFNMNGLPKSGIAFFKDERKNRYPIFYAMCWCWQGQMSLPLCV